MILKILYRQPLRLWQTLRRRHKLEALFLALVLFAVPATRAHVIFGQWLESGLNGRRLLFFLLWSFLSLWVLIQIPLFHFLAGRQKTIMLTAQAPASPRQARQILFYISLKYQLLSFFIIAPLYTAFAARDTAGAVLLAVLTLIGAALSWRGILYLYLQRRGGAWGILWGASLTVMAGGFWAYFRHLEFYYLGLFLFAAALYAFRHRSTGIDMQIFIAPVQRTPGKTQRYLKWRGNETGPAPRSPLQAWVFKERLARRRTLPFRRWRRATFGGAFFAFYVTAFSSLPEKNLIIFGMAVLYTWLFLGTGFNEKYRDPESPWLIQSSPLRLRDWWLARLRVEGSDALRGLALIVTAWWIGGLEAGMIAIYVATLTVLWFIFLAATINFQIMFYDDVRMAGYAFHLTMLLLGIMILNYHLVGPLIALALMLFFSYKNYKYINR